MRATKGYLLVSDISGYTRFLVESELQHAKEILDTLLGTTISLINAPVQLLKTEGDAVFAFVNAQGFAQPQSLLEAMRQIYFEFRRQLGLMDMNTTCECNACANMSALDIKVFLHYGEYIEQQIGESLDLQGSDVILLSRLMKNHVTQATGLIGYGLISQSAVDALDAGDLVRDMSIHHETYEHFGEVAMRIWDLPSVWDESRVKARQDLTPETAWVTETRDTSASQWRAWDVATDSGQKKIYYDMISVDRVDVDGGLVGEGTKYHCVHEFGDVTFTITDWNPPFSFESDEVAFGMPVHFAMRIEPNGEGSTLRIMYREPQVNDVAEVEDVFRGAARDALSRLVGILDEQ